MNRTRTNDRARRFIASVCAYGCTIVLPLSLMTATANAQSRWSTASPAPPVAAPEATPTLPQTPAPPAVTAPAVTAPAAAAPAAAAPTATAAAASEPKASPAPPIETTAAIPSTTELPPVPGLRRLPPVEQEAIPRTVAATTNPPSDKTAAPIDWRRPTMVMGPVPAEAEPHQSPVQLISNIAPQPQRTPQPEVAQAVATDSSAAEIMPAHTMPENGATPAETNPVEAEPAPSQPVATSRYAAAPTPAVTVPVTAGTKTLITPLYATNTSQLENPAENNLLPPAEKPHFARVTDESLSSPAPQDGLSPIYVCRLLGLKAAKK